MIRNGMRGVGAAIVVLAAALCTGCASGAPAPSPSDAAPSDAAPAPVGDTATWVTDGPTGADADTVVIEVTRLGCASGETGEVLEPTVTLERDRILVVATVAPLPGDAYTCQGNPSVAVTVELPEPVGDRLLVDAACLDGEAVSTAFCADGAVRWTP